ncbi:S-layer homology domain-containing protein [Paenibacillus soyae]|uniref:S-layer homology domain-containing protein n=1 Tax=Paenibacillus soyae TaxID=2969249 RepID=A0A9X2N0I3_9BACL|nr:S-layer homology domain-containing protein [Paenibacillus soyae]MCR2806862.1 S-layer homology domain-containing protein [Paenibacillus soyae]
MIQHLRILFALASLLLIVQLFPSMAAADSRPTFSLEAIVKGARVQVEVTGHQLSDVYAYQFQLAYDEKRLRFVAAESPIKGFTVEPIVKEGSILFAHSKIGKAEGTDGKATLASITFEMKAGGSSEFTLHDIGLVDSELSMVELETNTVLRTVLPALFPDIAGHWAEASIQKAVELGFVTGYQDGTFRPERQVTRAEFSAMIVRALEWPAPIDSELPFTDRMSIPNWARSDIAAAVEAKLLKGYEDGTFRSEKLITRSEMAAIIVRAKGITPELGLKPVFDDTGDIPLWAQPYTAVAVQEGLVRGIGNNLFAPLRNATRAEAVHLIVSLKSMLNEA